MLTTTAPQSEPRPRERVAWTASVLVHGAAFLALAIAATLGATDRPPIPPSQVRFEVARPPPRPHAPPPRPPEPPPAARVPVAAPISASSPAHHASAPSHAPRAARTVAAPPVATANGRTSESGNGMASGNNSGFAGGEVGNGTGSQPAQEPAPAREPPHPPPPPPPPADVPDDQLAVHPNIGCNGNAVAALYPQAAQDAEIEGDIAVEATVDRSGRIVRVRARNDPGFGLAAAAEHALMSACRTTAIPRDVHGNAVGTRVIHTIRFHLD